MSAIKDRRKIKLEGMIFGKLKVIEYVGNSQYKCICECGNGHTALSSDMRKGKTKSCGCLNKSRELDIVGQKFNMLTVIERLGKDETNRYLFMCLCDCGNKRIAQGREIKGDKIKSCGDKKHNIESVKNANTTHGMTNSRIYGIHRGMKKRCYLESNEAYPRYGGRGITICDDWLGENGFINFYNWAMENGYSEDLSIDRIDVNGSYTPDNCTWATPKEQANNRTTTLKFTYENQTKTLVEWCEELDLNYDSIWKRIYKYNYSFEKAITNDIHKIGNYIDSAINT